MDLKSSLKVLKLHEPTISALLGALVIIALTFVAFNYFKAKSSTTNILNGAQTENTANQSAPNPEKYTVQKGDHLWKIAQDHYKDGYKWTEIAKANNLKNPSVLVAGQELTLPEINQTLAQSNDQTTNVAPQALSPPNPPAPPQPNTVNQSTDQVINADTYTVVAGDSLWKIAVRAYGDGYRWPQIAKLNNLKNPNRILVNQTLKLPAK